MFDGCQAENYQLPRISVLLNLICGMVFSYIANGRLSQKIPMNTTNYLRISLTFKLCTKYASQSMFSLIPTLPM